ncbi:extracellular solute-binding protein [Labrys wisconsinensis]|uniref:Multiple sugar transport system substrate-binding protein n=1 Tax=Labrys wisconsinensis TaxID=425677 RepID=A0ABU0J4Z8_9HYPH|nr:extracellular solute-binding protein [Labrys wisconsinensis]MDQ0469345.1 multiple sugar transport system substrate-binding protein [Labrys wisconsinensis]
MKSSIAALAVISGLLAAGLGLAATMSATAARAGGALTVSFSNPAYKAFLEEAGRRFESDHPGVSVAYMAPVATHGEHLARTLRLAVTGELQDVSFQSYDQIAILARRGLGVPLNGLIAAEKDWNAVGLTPASVDACKVGDRIYALPFESATPTLFFNLDLVRRAGGDPDHLPTDWDGILALAGKIHALGDKITGGFFDYNASGNWTFQAMITSQGGRLMSEDDGKIAFDGPEGRRALDIIRRFGQTGMVDMSQDQAFQAFAAGQIGVITQANTYLSSFEEKARGHFEIRTMRWPLLSDRGRIPIGGRSMMMLTTDPKKQAIAWDYMKFVASAPMQTLLAKMTSTTPVNMIAIRGPDYLGAFYAQPNQRAAVEALQSVTGWYTFPGGNAARIVETLRTHLRNVAIEQTDVDKALAAMTSDVKALLP